jgi:GNAT superfamily N-acetyltransferase
MEKQLPNELTYVLLEKNKLIGTVTLFKNEIKRLFILPKYQNKGYGKILLNELEKNIEKDKYNIFILDSSLGAIEFYLKNGYEYKNYKIKDLPDGNYLCYLEMDKNTGGNYIFYK